MSYHVCHEPAHQRRISGVATERLSLRIDAVRAAVAEASKGEFISQEAMDTWIDSWDSDAELPPPEPDIQLRSR